MSVQGASCSWCASSLCSNGSTVFCGTNSAWAPCRLANISGQAASCSWRASPLYSNGSTFFCSLRSDGSTGFCGSTLFCGYRFDFFILQFSTPQVLTFRATGAGRRVTMPDAPASIKMHRAGHARIETADRPQNINAGEILRLVELL